jgi:hypothetical protein
MPEADPVRASLFLSPPTSFRGQRPLFNVLTTDYRLLITDQSFLIQLDYI